ncbi:MAG: DNA polymerase IV [Deltaproteobacteria bacterium]|nr:DNA polymerase IV [Deltaproteobacteria bacterium]
MRRILHLDMDAFFAAVEEKLNPALGGMPVIIGARDPRSRGVVSTASYAARRYGVHSGMPLKTAFQLCPLGIFLPVNYDAYIRESRAFKKILHSISPQVEEAGIDEAYIDISEMPEEATQLGRRIKESIRQELALTCSIGIAPNKLLAKIASDFQKPDGLTIVSAVEVPNFLAPLSVRKLIGVGPKSEARLKKMGIATVEQLREVPIETLVEAFGFSYGEYLYAISRGIDDRPLITHWEPKSISRETTFQRDVGDWQIIARTLAELTKEVVQELKEQQQRAKTVTLKIRFADFTTITRAKTLEMPLDEEEPLRKAAFACLKRVELRQRVRLLGVRVGNFATHEGTDTPAMMVPQN